MLLNEIWAERNLSFETYTPFECEELGTRNTGAFQQKIKQFWRRWAINGILMSDTLRSLKYYFRTNIFDWNADTRIINETISVWCTNADYVAVPGERCQDCQEFSSRSQHNTGNDSSTPNKFQSLFRVKEIDLGYVFQQNSNFHLVRTDLLSKISHKKRQMSVGRMLERKKFVVISVDWFRCNFLP